LMMCFPSKMFVDTLQRNGLSKARDIEEEYMSHQL
jgi:hypothetical protein